MEKTAIEFEPMKQSNTNESKSITFDRLLEFLSYNRETGAVTVNKSKRKLIADESGLVTVYDPVLKIKKKIKLDVLAWVLFNKREFPPSYKILHKNLSISDNSAKNLIAIPKPEYSKVSEALNNLQHYMKVQLHPNDQYKYVLYYRLDGVERKGTYDDIDTARTEMKQLELYFVKLINKYAITV